MEPWNDPDTRTLLSLLLQELDAQLEHSPPDEAVVAECDGKLYAAKRRGRNRVV